MTGWAQQIVARNIRARDGINHLRASRARTSGSSYFIIFVQNFRFIYRMVSTQRPPVLIWKTLINDESWFEWNVLCDDSAEWGYSHGEILGTQPCRGGRPCCVTCHTMGCGLAPAHCQDLERQKNHKTSIGNFSMWNIPILPETPLKHMLKCM